VRTDVAVIGAGPAGAWTAYTLATRGARVVLVDPSHPREKPCGGGVTGRALELVAGAIDVARVPASVIRRARFAEEGEEGTGVALGRPVPGQTTPVPPLVVVSRAAFDGALADAAVRAGATLVAARVRDITADGTGFHIDTTRARVRADRIVGADGANSLVRRRVARPFRREQLSIATGYFARGTTSDEIVIEFVADPPGYIWSFPRPDHLAIGICAQADAGVGAGALQARVRRWIERTRIADGAELQPYSWPIPSLGAADFERLDIAGRGWCLAGDAAGLVDPITREGIYFALLSGQWAADWALAADASRMYTTRVRAGIGRELARAARLKAGFFTPRFTRLLGAALRESAPIRAVMADLIAGRQPYAGLKWRLVRTFEVGLAWRVLRSRLT
jgi:geranylgeranyl reductase family protein